MIEASTNAVIPLLQTPQARLPQLVEDAISGQDFLKVDLRIAKIIEAKSVEGADKLVQVTLDIGEKQLNVFAGIKKF